MELPKTISQRPHIMLTQDGALPSNQNPPAEDNAVTSLEEAHRIEQVVQDHYPTRRNLHQPSPKRLRDSLKERPLDVDDWDSHRLPREAGATLENPETVLYLAYGSNLCAETFQGKRGIQPLAAINVVVPELIMTFDLPGIPYTEPCFANTKYRHIPSSSPSSISEKSPLLQVTSPNACLSNSKRKREYQNPQWRKGLVGVVYEVSLSDYAHIIATEGGGSSYQDILIVCYPLTSDATHVPSDPSTPPFKAHTLYSPIYPPGKAPPSADGTLSRPDPGYAQPSPRYLKLITNGAEEHAFPAEYKAYLHRLQPYTMTSSKQQLGRWIFHRTWWPIIVAVFRLNARFANKRGRSPKWLSVITSAIFRGVWASYDGFFYPLFGDGERTQESDSDVGGGEDFGGE